MLTRTGILYLRSRYFLTAILLAITSILGILSLSNSAHAAVGTVTEYSIPIQWQSTFDARELALGPDNQIWHTGYQRISKLTTAGSFTQYLRGFVYDFGITAGADGNIWFGETGGKIIKMATNGTVLATYTTPSGYGAMRMVLGPDDAVWFVGLPNSHSDGNGIIGKITTDGTITEYAAAGNDITTGPDGNMWFTIGATGSYNNKIGKITTSGTVTLYSIPTYNAYPRSITAGSDGNLWFTEIGINKIGKITTAGTITEYSLPNSPTGPYGITTGSDGALWITGTAAGKILRMTTSGTVTNEYSVPGASSGSLTDIITGNDGAVWYINHDVNKIGRIATELSNQTISFTSTVPASAIVDGPTYTPTASATSSLPVAITVDSSSASVCSIVSGVVSFQGAGTCTLNANQGGDADYNAAPQVQQSFTVAPVSSDISVALDCPATALISTAVECTITIVNDGPAAAKGVSLNALFSDSFGSVSTSGGGTLSGQSITWSSASLAPSASVTLTFNATATLASRASFSAALLQTNPDPNISNNIADAKVLIH